MKNNIMIINKKSGDIRISTPNLFIAGAPKCGTTSIYNYLKEHPQVFGPELKEPRFLAHEELYRDNEDKLFRKMIVGSEAEYFRLYQDGAGTKYRMDGTPHYMFYESAIKKIRDISDDSRVIVSIRNPVDRVISLYNMMWNRGIIQSSFEEFIEDRRKVRSWEEKSIRLYSGPIKMIKEILGEDRVLVVLFDELRDDTAGTLMKIYRFLGIDNLIPANINKAYYSNKKLIKSGPVRNLLTGGFARFLYTRLPDGLVRRMKSIFKMKSLYSDTDISEETMAKLKEFYKEEIKRTEEVTGFDLSAWKV